MTLRNGLTLGGTILIIIFFCVVIYTHFSFLNRSLIFSSKAAITVLWENYKKDYIDNSGRVINFQQGNITTSEGQSYALLQAVWMDDQSTFDKVFSWTTDNLQHKKGDTLFSWLYGSLSNGTSGVLISQGGNNSATDADTDIALALIFAYSRWKNDTYLNSAKTIISDIWSHEVVVVKGVPYIVSNNIEKQSKDRVVINPSYLAPYAYRIFAKVDTQHDWMAVVDSSYKVLREASSLPLDKKSSAGLPPDWVSLNLATNALEAGGNNLSTDFSFDALRVVWRIAIDYEWFKDPRAKSYLDSLSFFSREWDTHKKISSVYTHDGVAVSESETPAMYGGVIGYFKISDLKNTQQVYREKIESLFNQDTNSFKEPLSYYDANWAWFGMGLYNNLLHNISSF